MRDDDREQSELIAELVSLRERIRLLESSIPGDDDHLQRAHKERVAVYRLATNRAVVSGKVQAAAEFVAEVTAEVAEVGRVSVWLLDKSGATLRCLDLFEQSTGRHSSGTTLNSADYPQYFAALGSDRAIDAHDACTDQRTCEFAEGYLKPLGITSMLDAAIRVSGRVAGIICIEHTGPARRWFEDEIAFAGEAADQMAQALLNQERRRSARALHESRRMLQLVLDTIPVRVFWKDKNLDYLGCNAHFAHDAGLDSVDEIVGKNDFQMSWREQAEAYRADDRQVIESGVPRMAYEEPQTWPDGTQLWLRTSKIPLRNTAGDTVGVLGVYEDITEEKAAESERRRLEARMQHAQKLESLGVLAGGIAHDFNNLLMSILGSADLALHDLPESSPAIVHLEEVEKAARRAADLCRQMLAYSGKGRFELRKISLTELVEEMVGMLEVGVSKKATLACRFDADLPAVEADPTQIRQVVMNLITNASESISEGGGAMRVYTGCMHCEADFLRETYLDDDLPAGDYVFFEVSDTGCGMDKETRRRIFDPFFSTKFTGRGLGLAAVLGIVRGHRGAVKIYSEPGKGTTFKVLLPAAKGEAESLDSASPADADWRGSGTVLLVDDESSVRSTAKRMVERCGFDVLVTSSGPEAIERFREQSNEITLVILDLTMPEMDGDEVFQALQAIDANVPVVLSSGYNEQEVVQRFADGGLAGFIQKPYQLRQLRAVIRSALD